jgi:hypothetical protein
MWNFKPLTDAFVKCHNWFSSWHMLSGYCFLFSTIFVTSFCCSHPPHNFLCESHLEQVFQSTFYIRTIQTHPKSPYTLFGFCDIKVYIFMAFLCSLTVLWFIPFGSEIRRHLYIMCHHQALYCINVPSNECHTALSPNLGDIFTNTLHWGDVEIRKNAMKCMRTKNSVGFRRPVAWLNIVRSQSYKSLCKLFVNFL